MADLKAVRILFGDNDFRRFAIYTQGLYRALGTLLEKIPLFRGNRAVIEGKGRHMGDTISVFGENSRETLY